MQLWLVFVFKHTKFPRCSCRLSSQLHTFSHTAGNIMLMMTFTALLNILLFVCLQFSVFVSVTVCISVCDPKASVTDLVTKYKNLQNYHKVLRKPACLWVVFGYFHKQTNLFHTLNLIKCAHYYIYSFIGSLVAHGFKESWLVCKEDGD